MRIGISFLSQHKSMLGFEITKGIEPDEMDSQLVLQKNVRITIGLLFLYFDITFDLGHPMPFEDFEGQITKHKIE